MSQRGEQPDGGNQVLDPGTIEDLQRLQAAQENPHFIAQLVKLFFENAPRRLAKLREALDARDVATVGLVSHTLRSNAAMLGALRMAGLCERVESTADIGTLDGVGELLDRLDAEFALVRQALTQLGAGD
jgi:HPt (histidine-containing phosphotransfer) domain-containing protein